ncbi:MAG: hypothetical protein HY719_01230, partial [Planctomycetes bacterium]|nr:hypothetical protein [Planctomycetota bacterium]
VLALLATGGARPRALVLGGAGALARGERFAATISTAAGGDPARLAIREEAAVSPEDLGPDAEREGR